jgi:hypothetical protein
VNDVDAGTVLTLAIPLSLLVVVLCWWGLVVVRARRAQTKTRAPGS